MNKYIQNMLALYLLPLCLLGIDGSWIEGTSMPEARFGHAVAAMDSIIYVSGGRSGASGMHAARAQLWAYNILTDTWTTTLPALPEPRVNHVMVAISDTLWVFGGRNQAAIVVPVIFWAEGNDQWQHVSDFPNPREGMNAFVRDGMVYLIGGKTSHSMWSPPSARVDRFDPRTLTWMTMDSLNQARVDFAAAVHGDTVMCFGGRFIDPISSVEQGQLGGAWQNMTALPVPRSNSNAVYFQNKYVLIGGFNPNGQADNNLAFDGVQWSDFESNLLPRNDAAVFVSGAEIYILGGRNGNRPLRSVEYFLPAVGVHETAILPENNALIKTYPNPFNGSVVIEMSTSETELESQTLVIYNLKGVEVFRQSLPEDRKTHRILLSGKQLGSSGIYISIFSYILPSGQIDHISQKLIQIK